MTINPDNEIVEKLVANKLMIEMSRAISESMSQFAAWLLLGFSASFTLILANIATVSNFVETASIKSAVLVFLVSLLVAVVQRWIAASIMSGHKSGDAGAAIDAELNAQGIILNQSTVLSELEKASYYPAKWLIKIQFKKFREGDLTVGGRQQLKMSQIQALLMLVQVLLAAASIAILMFGLKV